MNIGAVWRADVQLYANAAVCLRCKIETESRAGAASESHQWALADSESSSLTFFRQADEPFQQY
jgi:hypothetical protein